MFTLFVNAVYELEKRRSTRLPKTRLSRRKEDREARHQLVLDVALELIEERGLDHLSMHKLSKELGYTVGALYRYFPSKSALISSLQCQVLDVLKTSLEALMEDVADVCASEPSLIGITYLRGIITFYAEYTRHSSSHFYLNSRLLGDPKILVEEEDAGGVKERVQALMLLIGMAMMQAGVASEQQEALKKALIFWSGLHGVLQVQKIERYVPGGLDMVDLSKQFSQALLLGWGASPDDVVCADQYVKQLDERTPFELRADVKGVQREKRGE
ncbi:MAG TPA: hypothetical protein DCE42_18710 [Myxococcales bacterium]|nr:hypothetical protein [Myxococcales bacterium]